MRVYHYTASIPECIDAKDQTKSDGRKPIGFWVSDCDRGDGWREWCEGEQWRLDQLSNRMLIDLDMRHILSLKSIYDIDAFSIEYQKNYASNYIDTCLIDWPAVARDFKGILISPYQWSRRLDGEASNWYYGWDCASGCIWDPDAITGVSIDTQWPRVAAA